MNPIKFYVFPREEIERLTRNNPLSQSFLSNWEATRPGVLDDDHVDIFCHNCRSDIHPCVRFELFERVDKPDDDTLIVLQTFLELFEADGCRQNIASLMNAIRSEYPLNPKLWSWNHDRNQADVPELRNLPSNEFVLSYNTSRPAVNDILLPFWTIDCRSQWNPDADRPLKGGFIGYVGSLKLRQNVVAAFANQWKVLDATDIRIDQDSYMRAMLGWDYALCPRGGGLSSYRFFEALQQGCIPILFADDVALPYPDLDWGSLIVRLPERDAGCFHVVWDLIKDIDVKERRRRIAEVRSRFTLGGVQAEIHRRISEYLER